MFDFSLGPSGGELCDEVSSHERQAHKVTIDCVTNNYVGVCRHSDDTCYLKPNAGINK